MSDAVATKEPPKTATTETFEELTKEYARLKAYKKKHVEPRYQDVTQLVLPKYGEYGTLEPWPDFRYDPVGTECSQLLAFGMFGNLSPSSQNWFRYIFLDQEATDSKEGGKTLEEMTRHMVGVFNRSGYYDSGPEFLGLGNAYGAATMDVREDRATGKIICTNAHPRSYYYKTNARGEVETIYAALFLTAEQAADEWKEELLDEPLKQEIRTGSDTLHEFVEMVRRNKNAKPESPLASDWEFEEIVFYVNDARKQVITQSGARTLSKISWRWGVLASNPYGWGPIDDSMPDIRTANQIVRTMLDSLQRGAKPARYDPEEGRAWSHEPDARNFYRDPNRRSFTDTVAGQNYAQMKDMLDHIQQRCRKTLNVDHFLMLMQIEAQMTAREVVERKREGMSVTSATVGKFETEALDRLHARMLMIEAMAGRLPGYRPGDRQEQKLLMKGLKVEYLGPISQLQRQIFIEQGIVTAIETSIPVFKFWPESLLMVKPDEAIRKIWSAHATPAEMLRTPAEYQDAQKLAAEHAQAAQANAMKAAMASKIDPNAVPAQGSPAEAMLGQTSAAPRQAAGVNGG